MYSLIYIDNFKPIYLRRYTILVWGGQRAITACKSLNCTLISFCAPAARTFHTFCYNIYIDFLVIKISCICWWIVRFRTRLFIFERYLFCGNYTWITEIRTISVKEIRKFLLFFGSFFVFYHALFGSRIVATYYFYSKPTSSYFQIHIFCIFFLVQGTWITVSKWIKTLHHMVDIHFNRTIHHIKNILE